MTLRDLLEQKLPTLMAEFEQRPWDYRLEAPTSLDAPLRINVYLHTGPAEWRKTAQVEINLETASVRVVARVNA